MRHIRVGYDRYKLPRKLREPTRCKDCGALYREGRWVWAARGGPAYKVRCPACQRIKDARAAGFVRLTGEYFAGHRAEILRRVRRCGEDEMSTHPLERIIAITPAAEGDVVTTTGVHLARRIAHALQHAFKGELEARYNKGEKVLRVQWNR